MKIQRIYFELSLLLEIAPVKSLVMLDFAELADAFYTYIEAIDSNSLFCVYVEMVIFSLLSRSFLFVTIKLSF